MKKIGIFLTSSILALGTSVSESLARGAPPAPVPTVSAKECGSCEANCVYTGWYAGAQLGVGMTRNVNKWIAVQDRISGSNPHSMRGIMGGLHAGWGYQFHNNFYLGLEAFGNLFDNKSA